MLMPRRGCAPALPAIKAEYLIGALVAASIGLTTSHAATIGHSRIVSGVGQPLHIEIPVTQLTSQEIGTLHARPAPASAWREAGMTPPVALESMRLVLLDGISPDAKVIQLRSDQVFERPIVDILLDINTTTGQQRYQVSLVAHADPMAIQRPGESATHQTPPRGDGIVIPQEHELAGTRVRVRANDNMFKVARRNAVEGVTIYQMMMALQRSNPQAFIEDNVNLVRSGATLTMPGIDVLTQLSDREARRLFVQHNEAFARYRQRGKGLAAIQTAGATVAQGAVADEDPGLAELESALTEPAPTGDRLRLSAPPDAGSRNVAVNGMAAANGFTNGAVVGNAGGNAASGHSPRVNMLASSGAIASDAVSQLAPGALSSDRSNGSSIPFGSDAASGGTVVEAGNGGSSMDPDDQTALRKNVGESGARILELEDNVRHLNEALQNQGQVAAEAALEGARSVTEVIKEIINLVDPEDEADTNVAGATDADSTKDGGKASVSAGQGNGTEAGTASRPDSGATTGQRSADAAGATQDQDGAAASAGNDTGSGGSGTDIDTGSAAGSEAAGGGAGGAASTGAGGGTGVASVAAPGANGAGTGTPGSEGGPGTKAISPASQTGAGSPASAPSAADRAATTRTEREVSWFEENILLVLGGALGLVVLIVVWLLRRSSSSKYDPFESDSPITDTMVREKLRDIDLDLDSTPGGAGRPTS